MKNLSFFLSCLLTIFFMDSCKPTQMNQPSRGADHQGSEALYQYTWNLLELEGTAVTSFKTPYLQFSQGQVNRVSGNTGCNELSGAFVLSGERGIRFSPLATTRMACLGDYNESAFLSVLQKATEWRISDKDMFLYEGRMQLARFHAALPSNAAGPGNPNAINGSWELTYITGPRISFEGLYPEQKPELIINSLSPEANGHSSCNPFSCPMTIQGNKISFGDARATLMYCPGIGESTFFSLLKNVNRYAMEDDQTMLLLQDDVPLMKFRRK